MAEKFSFENNFDHLSASGTVLPPSAKPEDLIKIEEEGRAKGFQEGHKAAYQEIDATTNMLLTTLSGQMEKMIYGQKKMHGELEKHALSLAFEAFEKLLPGFVASDQCQTSFQRLGEAIRLLDGDQEIRLKVSKTLHESITRKIASGEDNPELPPHLKIEADAHLDPTDFTLSWNGGSLVYAQRRLERELLALLTPSKTTTPQKSTSENIPHNTPLESKAVEDEVRGSASEKEEPLEKAEDSPDNT